MADMILNSGWFAFYLVCVGSLGVAFVCDWLRNAPAAGNGGRNLPHKLHRAGVSLPVRVEVAARSSENRR